MSVSDELQRFVFETLTSDPAVTALIGDRVRDLPPADVAAPCITFGPSDFVDERLECLDATEETLQLDIWSEAQDGFRECKLILAAARKALDGASGPLGMHALVRLRVESGRSFRDPDGISTHGILMLVADLEAAS